MRKDANEKTKYYFSDGLKRMLAQISQYPLIVVEAPSGCGKTTAVREYLMNNIPNCAHERWYTCLGGPPSETWRGFCDLLASVSEEAAAVLRKISEPKIETLLYISSALRNLQCTSDTYIVIDNYHLMNCEIPWELISVFSMHGNPNLHIIFITQQLGPKPLGSVHNNNVHTIHADELFFDRQGIYRLFLMEGIRLSPEELEKVFISTSGWASALRIQIINYKETGTFGYTADIEELVKTAVWDRLKPAERSFLVSVSVMDGFTAQQAAAITGRRVISDDMKTLLHSSDFIRYHPDNGIYMIHSILQEFLKNRFTYFLSREFQSQVLQRAGKLYADMGDYHSAADIFYSAKNYEAILALPSTGGYLVNQKHRCLKLFIDKFVCACPEDVMIKYPFKLLLYAYFTLFLQSYETYEKLWRLIDSVIQNPAGLSGEELRTLRGEFILLRSIEPGTDPESVCKIHEKAWAILQKPSVFVTSSAPWLWGHSVLNMFWCKQGMLEHTEDEVRKNMVVFRKLSGGYMAGAENILRAEMMAMRGKDEEAEILCHRALYDARSHGQTGMCLCVELILAQIAILRGNVDAYQTAVGNIENYPNQAMQSPDLRTIELCLSVIGQILGIQDNVPEWLYNMEHLEDTLYSPATLVARLLHAKILLTEKRYNEFYGLSSYIMDHENKTNYIMPMIFNRIFLAQASRNTGNKTKAQEYLKEALELALPDQVYLPFAQQEGMEECLLEIGGSFFSRQETTLNNVQDGEKHLTSLIELCRRQRKGANAIKQAILFSSPLTPREREIAMLARERLSVKEIAHRLHIAETTVKATLRSIYSKLGIHSKAELNFVKF